MHNGLLQVREYLEKHYQELSGMEAVKMAIKALTETVEAGSKNIEVCSITSIPLPVSNSFFSGLLKWFLCAAMFWVQEPNTVGKHIRYHLSCCQNLLICCNAKVAACIQPQSAACIAIWDWPRGPCQS